MRAAAAADAEASKPKKSAPSLVEPVLRALGAKTSRLGALRTLIEGGLTTREVMAVAFAELYAILDLPTAGEGAVDPIRKHIQIGKALDLLARLAADDKDRAPRDVRLHVTVGGGSTDSAGNGPVNRETVMAQARARGFEFERPTEPADPAIEAG